jgi:hypothetical protein
VTLVPFHGLHDRRYTVYIDKLTKAEWAAREAELRAEEARRKALEARTVDFFQPGEMQPERDHNLRAHESSTGEFRGRKYRHAHDGWFSFEMKVDADRPNTLSLTYWGSDIGNRTFDVLVNDRKIATQTLSNNHPGRFWDQTHELPAEWTKGKKSIVVTLRAHPGNMAGGLFGARTLRAD